MTGNPSIDKVIIAINALVISACVGLVYYSNNMIKPKALDTNAEFSKMVDDSMVELKKQPIVFKEIVLNLYSRQRRLRFLNLILNIDVFEEGQKEIIATYKPKIIDSLIDITGNMKPQDLNSITGKILLESRLKNKVNNYIGKPVIKKIYFSKFIVQ